MPDHPSDPSESVDEPTRTPDGHTIGPDGTDIWRLQGRVIDKVVNQGTPMQRRIGFALEKEAGGDFLALHGDDLDFGSYLDKRVEVEGRIWMRSFTAQSIKEIDED
ncbi:MAG TPA: hypothetical protein VNS19_03875 [Acidimicrobiales bacterium]|nr:hypothetical protein [Acidimicrobiales bacterium]